MKRLGTTLFFLAVIASLILSACGLAQPTPTQAPGCNYGDSVATEGQILYFNSDPKVCVMDEYNNGSWIPLADYVADMTPAPTNTPADAPALPASTGTPTLAPEGTDSHLVFLVGGKLIGNVGYETIAKSTLEYIAEETSLQMYYSQLVPQGFVNTYVINATEEILNDGGVQWLVYQRNGVWQVVEVSRDFGITNNFSQTSCIKFSDWTLTVWMNDAGQPGTWVGDCSETYNVVYTKDTLERMKSDPNFSPYVDALLRAMANTNDPFNHKIELVEVFKK